MSDDRERLLRMQLAELQRRYSFEAKPIIDELVDIEARKPPRPVVWEIEGGGRGGSGGPIAEITEDGRIRFISGGGGSPGNFG